MHSVLNESNIFDTIKGVIDSIDGYNKDKNKKAEKNHYLGGSISRYTKDLIMSFPILCDDTLSIDTAQMISKANEKNIVTMLQIMFTSMSLEGSNGAEIIKSLHRNLDSASIDDIIDALDDFADKKGVSESGISSAEMRDIIREMCYQLKNNIKTFPESSFSETSILDYKVHNMNGRINVLEAISEDEYRENKDRREENRDKREEEREKREKERNDREKQKRREEHDASEREKYKRNEEHEKYEREKRHSEEKRNEEREKRGEEREKRAEEREKRGEEREKRAEDREKHNDDKRRTDSNLKKDAADLFAKQILDSDFKKANELQPTLMVINFVPDDQEKNGRVISFVAGVKSRMIGSGAIDIIERLIAKNKSKLSFKNLIRSTTGEIGFFKDFILATKQNKLNAKNAAKKGASAQMWNLLEKRSTANSYQKFSKHSNSAAAITTLVINKETVDFMKANYKFDLMSIKNIRLIMDSYNLLGLVIADEANEVAHFIYDGNDQFEKLSYSALAKDAADKNYKKVVNLINQAGR